MDMLVWGYGLVEAPRVNEIGQVYFSDVLNGGVYRWSPDGTVTTIIPKRRGVGGLLFHQDGGVSCREKPFFTIQRPTNEPCFSLGMSWALTT